VLDDAFKAGSPALKFKLDQQDVIPGLLAGLVGAQKGERLVYAIPPAEGFGPAGKPELGLSATDTLIVVADVATVAKTVIPPSTITGAPVASPAGMPTVDFAKDAQEPTVKVPGGAAPAALQQATIVQGTGAEVKKGQTLSAHYHGLLWKDCSIFDSSFRRGEPAAFEIGTGKVIKGWDDVLVGKKVGSRVLIVIPPKDGYGEAGSPPKIAGTDTLVFVVDIVGVS
jgi:peptidylprolyl isomerase